MGCSIAIVRHLINETDFTRLRCQTPVARGEAEREGVRIGLTSSQKSSTLSKIVSEADKTRSAGSNFAPCCHQRLPQRHSIRSLQECAKDLDSSTTKKLVGMCPSSDESTRPDPRNATLRNKDALQTEARWTVNGWHGSPIHELPDPYHGAASLNPSLARRTVV